MAETLVSVVIPVKDDPRFARVAQAILAQLPAQGELLVVDDGPRGSIEAVAGARMIASHQGNQALARNRGAEAARGEILIFTDADVVIPEGWLSTALEAFKDRSLVALQGGSDATDASRLGRWIQTRYDDFIESHRDTGYADLCDSRCFAIRRVIFLRFLFEADEQWCADAALGRRLYEAGIRTLYQPAWQVGHHYRLSLSSELWRVRRQAEAGAAHWNRTGRDLFRSPNAQPPAGVGGAALSLARGKPLLAPFLSRGAWSAARAAGLASRVAGRAGFPLFARACRWALLSGRLGVESSQGH